MSQNRCSMGEKRCSMAQKRGSMGRNRGSMSKTAGSMGQNARWHGHSHFHPAVIKDSINLAFLAENTSSSDNPQVGAGKLRFLSV